MKTIIQILSTSVGIFAAMTVWFTWMGYVRRHSGCRRDQDVLEHMAHGCGACQGDGACGKRKSGGETS